MQALRQEGEQPSFIKYFLEDPTLLDQMNRRQNRKIVLYDLPQIEPFRQLNKPVVSEEKKRIIKEKLDLQQQSLLLTKQRQKRNEYFLNYSENPFIELQPHRKIRKTPTNKIVVDENQMDADARQAAAHEKLIEEARRVKDKDKGKYIYDIVTQLNSMQQKPPQEGFLELNDNFKRLTKDASLFSNKIIEISANKEDFEFFKQKKIQNQNLIKFIAQKGLQLHQQKSKKNLQRQKSQLRNRSSTQDGKQIKKDVSNNPAVDKLPKITLSFDEICEIKQENFFMKPQPAQKPLNIFKLALNKSQKQMIGKEILDKYNFSFNSMVEKIQKIKVPIYRDISRMARQMVLDKSTGKDDRFDHIDSYELSFKTNSLNFFDLMSVASGRFTPQFVYKTTNFDAQNMNKETSQTSSQQEEEPIFYEDNTANIGIRFQNQGEQEQQILNYLKLQYNSKEKSYQTQCQKYKLSINSDLKMKQKLVSTTIQDRVLHGVLNRSIRNQMDQFVKMDERDMEIDRLIRMNKMSKNKNLAIKLDKVIQALELKRNHNEVIQKLGILQDEVQQDAEEKESENLKQKVNDQSPVRIKKFNQKPAPQEQNFAGYTHRKCMHQHMQYLTGRKAQTNTAKTPQKKISQTRVNNMDKSPIKNTIKKTPIWR